ncbi:MAG TPA: hypothetical protein ENN75_01395 [candidate division Zixibacteria bacterium]|nr:hypothetical protein [candidate division Zixibacteria bacterium]
MASVVSSGLYLLRAKGLTHYQIETPPPEAMEFADFPVKPLPLYPRLWLLGLAFLFSASAAILAIAKFEIPASVALIFAIIAFFSYDLPGAAVMAKLTALPNGILLENVKGPPSFFFLQKEDIKSIVSTNSGFYIELYKPALGNRMPMKTNRAEEILEKIEEMTGIVPKQ